MRLFVLLGALALASAAQADMPAGQACLTADGQVEPTATQGWQEALRSSDPRAVQFLTGTWYNRIDSPSTNQVSQTYITFEATGGMTFRNVVCYSNNTGCQTYDGYGMFAAQWSGQNAISLFRNVSDTHHSSLCSLSTFTFPDSNTGLGPDGAVALQRMQ